MNQYASLADSDQLKSMATDAEKGLALQRIEENIARHGHHVYMVSGGVEPRFAYTIGLSRTLGFERILAGACFYMADEVMTIITSIASKLQLQHGLNTSTFDMDELGSFSIRPVNRSPLCL